MKPKCRKKNGKTAHLPELSPLLPEDEQEALYTFPYHYLPEITNTGFKQHQYWAWGYRYLGRLQVVFDLLKRIEFDSLLDIGCGDGRFLRETRLLYPSATLAGVDISNQAISLAKQINPDLLFEQCDIIQTPMASRWSVITLLEVIEHIPPKKLHAFMCAVTDLLVPDGHIIITVPHKNEKLASKHYQHFESSHINQLLSGNYYKHKVVFFDHISIVLKILLKMMGGSGKYFIITYQGLSNLLYKYYIKKGLYGNAEKTCKRIAYIAQKK